MDATEAGAGAATWEARPLGGGRRGVVHRQTGRWVAFGGAARCRLLAAHLNEADAILRGPAPAGTASGSPDT
jgi:hypothetical protein